MKITKLRSFNKSENKFYYFLNGGYFDEKGQTAKPFRFDWENAEWFSALRDKNDKEIYEGDIIRGRCRVGCIEFDYCKIVYWEKHATFKCSTGRDTFTSLNGHYDYIEVIGNFSENPELLTGDKTV